MGHCIALGIFFISAVLNRQLLQHGVSFVRTIKGVHLSRGLQEPYTRGPYDRTSTPQPLEEGAPGRLTELKIVHNYNIGWHGSRVVSVLDSGAEGPGFRSQPRRCRVTVLGKLFTPIVPLFTKQRNW